MASSNENADESPLNELRGLFDDITIPPRRPLGFGIFLHSAMHFLPCVETRDPVQLVILQHIACSKSHVSALNICSSIVPFPPVLLLQIVTHPHREATTTSYFSLALKIR
jgi:hypothetical protein